MVLFTDVVDSTAWVEAAGDQHVIGQELAQVVLCAGESSR